MKNGIFINPVRNTKEMIKKYGAEKSKGLGVSMSTSLNLDCDENREAIDQYIDIIGSYYI